MDEWLDMSREYSGMKERKSGEFAGMRGDRGVDWGISCWVGKAERKGEKKRREKKKLKIEKTAC